MNTETIIRRCVAICAFSVLIFTVSFIEYFIYTLRGVFKGTPFPDKPVAFVVLKRLWY